LSRLPLACGSRLALVDVGDDAGVLAPPPPVAPIADVAAAVRDALHFRNRPRTRTIQVSKNALESSHAGRPPPAHTS
jgi:hypothetical protein